MGSAVVTENFVRLTPADAGHEGLSSVSLARTLL